ncbi:hypothetical protein AAZX31_08G131400 [Glycine max]
MLTATDSNFVNIKKDSSSVEDQMHAALPP